MKKLFLTVVAMLGATTLFAQTDIVTLAKQGTDAAKAGNFDEAITLFDEVINSYWDIEEPTANDEKALAMAQKYIVTCYNKLGGRAWNAKDYETAIEYFTQAANNAELYNNEADRVKNLSYVGNCYEAMGATAFNNGNFEEAIEVFSKGYAADSRNTNMALNLAESYFKSNKYQDGMRVCSEVASLNANKYAEAIAAAHAKMDLYTNNEVAKLQQANDYDGIIALANELPDAAIAQKVSCRLTTARRTSRRWLRSLARLSQLRQPTRAVATSITCWA